MISSRVLTGCVSLSVLTFFSIARGETGDVGQKGSLLVYPNIELRWDLTGNLIQDTYITLSNDYPEVVNVQLYFVNGDPPLAEDPGVERAHWGHNSVDNRITLTGNQPEFWSVATGLPANVSSFEVLDPGSPSGRPAQDGTTDRVLRGYIYAWAVNSEGEEICWNHLFGGATAVDYLHGDARQYGAYAFQVDSTVADHGDPTGTPGVLNLDGTEYQSCPAMLQLDFFPAGGITLSNAGRIITNDNVLTFLAASRDLRQASAGPVITNIGFDIWNLEGLFLPGTQRCTSQWDSQLVSLYGTVPNYFYYDQLATEKGRASIDGSALSSCGGSAVAVPLLGTSNLTCDFDGADHAVSCTTLPGFGGGEAATIQYDIESAPRKNTSTPELIAKDEKDDTGLKSVSTSDVRDAAISRFKLSKPGSLLIMPDIELRWDVAGNLFRDTFIELTNTGPEAILVQVCLFNGDPPLSASPPEPEHRGWNHSIGFIVLEPRQPFYWSAINGDSRGIPSFRSLDPGDNFGRPALDGTSDRVLRGYAYIWVVDEQGYEIRRNDLSGKVTTIDYLEGSSWAYLPYSFSIDSESIVDGQRSGTPGVLNLNGLEYGFCPSDLAMNFFASGSAVMSNAGRVVLSDTYLAILPVSENLTWFPSDTVVTKLKFDIYNGNEIKFSNTERCIENWDKNSLSSYDLPNHFWISSLGTDNGKVRIRGMASSVVCDPSSVDCPILGVSTTFLDIDGFDFARASTHLIGMGTYSTEAVVDEDCNNNGIMDNVELFLGDAEDCNTNSIPDECDIAGGMSTDINADNIPDECGAVWWTGGTGGPNGVYTDSMAWEDYLGNPLVPDKDMLYFELGSENYTVTFDTDPANYSVHIIGNDDVTFASDSQLVRRELTLGTTFGVPGELDIDDNSVLTLDNVSVDLRRNDRLYVGSGSELVVRNESVLHVEKGLQEIAGSIIVEDPLSEVYLLYPYFGDFVSISCLGCGQPASLTVQNGAAMTSGPLAVGKIIGSEGSVLVTGSGSQWITESLFIGGDDVIPGGTGNLDIELGGTVIATGAIGVWDNGSVHILSGGTIVADVLGKTTGAVFDASGFTSVVRTNAVVGFGDNPAFGGSLQLGHGSAAPSFPIGPGQGVTVGHTMSVGYDSQCSMPITNGTVNTNQSILGHQQSGSGVVTLTGAGASWNTDGIQIGNFGNGELTISDNANLSTYWANIGRQATGSGTVAVESGGSMELVEDLNVGYLGTGELIISDGSVSTEGQVYIRGGSLLELADGSLVAQGLHRDYGGTFEFTGGTLAVSVFEGDLEVEGGRITPGATENRTTNINGGLSIDAGGIDMEIVGESVQTWDRIVISNNAVVGGTLEVSFVGTELPYPRKYEIIDVGGNLSGQFEGLVEGSIVGNFCGTDFYITYAGGDGNDVVLYADLVCPGDFDCDGDVDLFDYGNYQICFGTSKPECLETFDFDISGTIDLVDYAEFANLLDGPASEG